MAVNYPTSLDTVVGTGTSGQPLSVGGPGGESHVGCHSDISSVTVSLETNVSKPCIGVYGWWNSNPPSTNYATFVTRDSGGLGALRFPHAGTDTSVVFTGVVPNTAILTTGLKAVIKWASVTATTGNVEWNGSVDNAENAHSLDTDSYGTGVNVITAVNATAAYITTSTITIPNANLQSLAIDKAFKFLLKRRASDTTNDTMADNADLLFCYLYVY